MNTSLEKYLRCPLCLSTFKKIKNRLICVKNQHSYPIQKGIPILLDYKTLNPHSQNQQTHFEKIMRKKNIDSVIKLKYHEVRYIERFCDNFKKIKNKLMIEVGTGSGYMTFGLARRGAKIIACDITLSNLVRLKEFAKKMGLDKNILFICCSADQLPCKSNEFDYFIINAVLEHVPAEKKAIREITRILKKGGGLMIAVPVMYRYIFPLLLPINILHDKRIGHLRRYDDISLKKKFTAFNLKRVYFTGHVPKVIKFILNKFVKVYDEKTIEMQDARRENTKVWSSNVIAFFVKK